MIGLINAPIPVGEDTTTLGISVILTLFIGVADMITPSSIVKLYSTLPSVAVVVSTSYP